MKMNIVDAIPYDCCRKRRRPTMATQGTERCSDCDLSEIVVIALLSEDSESDSAEEIHNYETGTLCSTPPAIEMEEVMDLSMEKLLRGSTFASTSSSRLATLLEDNQRALQMLLSKEEAFLKSKEATTEECCVSTTPKASWREAWQFELQQSLPGVAALILYCIAHAATYELVSNLAYEAVEKAPTEAGKYSPQPWGLYTAMLVLGCLMARYSGVVWSFTSPLAYQRVKLICHNRIRLGAKDARWLHWLQQESEGLLGMVNLVSYYLCYIAVFFFVGQVAMIFDQREDILAGLPSTLYKEGLASIGESESAQVLLLQQNITSDFQDEDLEFFGPEDDLYFFQTLSRNSYDNFFGQDYETALFDSTHQILFFACLAATTIHTLKACLGFSFWAGW